MPPLPIKTTQGRRKNSPLAENLAQLYQMQISRQQKYVFFEFLSETMVSILKAFFSFLLTYLFNVRTNVFLLIPVGGACYS